MQSQSSLFIEILLVEDSASDANLTIRSFAQQEISPNRLHWVETGEAAIAYLRQEGEYTNQPRPHLILLDLNLPAMNGQEVLAQIKSDPILKRIPVIILTTSADRQDILRSYDLHANCYITKPITLRQFTQLVRLIWEFWLTWVKLPLDE